MARLEISKKTVLVNSASSAVTTVLNLSVLVWLQQYLLKRVSAEEYSLVPLLAAIMAFAPLLSTVLTGGIGRYVTVAHAKGNDDEVTSICSTMLPILVGGAIISLGVGWTCAWHIDHLVKIDPKRLWDSRIMMALLVLSAALQLPAAAFGSGFIVRQRLLLQDAIGTACQLLRLVVLFALLFGVSTRVLWVVVASVVGELANLAISTPLSIRLLPAQRFRRKAINWSVARSVTSYGGWSLVNQIAQTARIAMDPIVLNRFASALDVATFNVAGIAPRQFPALVGPISRPFIPIFAMLHAAGDTDRMRNTYLRTARYNTWLVMAIAVPAIIFSNDLMRLYLGDKYQGAGQVMAVLLAVPILTALNALGLCAIGAAGDMKGLAIRQVVVHAANLLLTLLFVAFLGKGALGSAVATMLATLFFDTVLTWRLSWKVTHTPAKAWLREVFAPTMIPALPPLLLCLALRSMFGITSWTILFSASALSAILYMALVALFGLRDQDRSDIGKIAHRLPGSAKNVAHFLSRPRTFFRANTRSDLSG